MLSVWRSWFSPVLFAGLMSIKVKKVQQFAQKSLLFISVIKDGPRSNLTTHLLWTQIIIEREGWFTALHLEPGCIQERSDSRSWPNAVMIQLQISHCRSNSPLCNTKIRNGRHLHFFHSKNKTEIFNSKQISHVIPPKYSMYWILNP